MSRRPHETPALFQQWRDLDRLAQEISAQDDGGQDGPALDSRQDQLLILMMLFVFAAELAFLAAVLP